MLFSSTFEKVMDGTKTQTRRPAKANHRSIYEDDGENFQQVEICDRHWKWRRLWKVGRTYAVQPGRGKESAGRIKLKKIRLEKLMDISIHDCLSEGIESTKAEELGYHVPEHRERFFELWDSLYKETEFEHRRNPDVWVLEFELVEKY